VAVATTAAAAATAAAEAAAAAATAAAAAVEDAVVALAAPVATTVAEVTTGASSGWYQRPGGSLYHPTRNGERCYSPQPRNARRTDPEMRHRTETPARTDPSRKRRGWAAAT